MVENWCKARLENKYIEVSKKWRMVSFKIYNTKAWQNLQHTLIIYASYLPQFYKCIAFTFFSGQTTHMFQLSAQKQFQASNQVESA